MTNPEDKCCEADKDFYENRISWRWFLRLWKKDNDIALSGDKGFTELLLIQILAELQKQNGPTIVK